MSTGGPSAESRSGPIVWCRDQACVTTQYVATSEKTPRLNYALSDFWEGVRLLVSVPELPSTHGPPATSHHQQLMVATTSHQQAEKGFLFFNISLSLSSPPDAICYPGLVDVVHQERGRSPTPPAVGDRRWLTG